MAPTIILIVCYAIFRCAGLLGFTSFDNWNTPLRTAFFLMFLMTASAHWGDRRPDLVRMVPPAFPRPEALVTVTGILEILGAVGLLIPATALAASVCLAILLIAIFPANIRAAHERLTILGRPVPGLAIRTVMQVFFITALLAAGIGAKAPH